jgi:lysophospholipase L1-like esterase
VTRPDAPGPAVYVALGDSISIDAYAGGPGRGGPSLLARNRDDDFPEWRGRDLATRHPSLRYHLLAVDGGTPSTLLDLQLPQLAGSGVAPTLVTLTVGGNDLLSAYGDTRRAREVVALVCDRVAQALTRLRRLLRSPQDPIVVGDVYDPSDGTGDASRVGLPAWPQVVDGNPAQPDSRPADRDLWYCNVIEPNAWGASAVRAAFWEALPPP